MPDVIVVGAGPVGLLLAGDLARRGIDATVLERRANAGGGSRAIGIHAPVLAALAPSGVTDRLLTHAVRVTRGEARTDGQVLGTVRFDRLRTPYPFVATLPQAATESVLAEDAPAPVRSADVREITPERGGVLVRTRAAEHRAPIVVVAAGAGSRGLVFRSARVREGEDRYLMADAPVGPRDDAGTAVVHLDRGGVLESFPLPGGRRRFVSWDAGGDDIPDDRRARLQDAIDERGEDATITAATSFGIRRFVAPRMRNGGIVVIGDAAHEVSPIGGQGMNLGLLDAATLAPILADWVRTGDAPDADLVRWEQRRVRSARLAGGLAGVNTRLGRALPASGHAARTIAVRAMLAPPLGRVFARAYAMGFDIDA